ncbi:ribosomal large subunit pseudouridine synthase [Reticulomyxa filosa]|uniref:Ribosomal large subunit pseudouridine synthase n=1 Tax=Reticulomyxa filosa TaxID=46433 RepID=X6NN41_RETFI|nr:ribosomal large subunit pseudouridine synthase [Reticulomyxa filosa]|eukprot:ETO27695.1 ribosomal large subunit pseudouridine synthase [Reticulomyxa filosa]
MTKDLLKAGDKMTQLGGQVPKRPTARLAVTHLRELEHFQYTPQKQRKLHHFSLLKCRVETGRTHQVRVHCLDQQIPLIGDDVYNIANFKKHEMELFADEVTGFDQMHYLHAYLLAFNHPVFQKRGEFTANPPVIFSKQILTIKIILFDQITFQTNSYFVLISTQNF